MRTIEQLERDLQADRGDAVLDQDRLARIRRNGARQRRGRRTAVGAGALIGAVVVVAGFALGGQGDVVREQSPASQDSQVAQAPPEIRTTMSDVAKRALRQIPGAQKVSAWQVVVPGPGTAAPLEESIAADRLAGETVDTGTRTYLDPSSFDTYDDTSGLPAWLRSSTDSGVLVDYGEAELACVFPRPDNGEFPEDVCRTSVITAVGDTHTMRANLGTDRFLQTGAPMEVFLLPDYSTGRPTYLAVAGLHGTEVARADFVSTDGTVTEGTVLTGSLAEHDTIMFANVPGDVASVIAYDDQGEVVENHQLLDCSGPVDCEVR